MEYLVPFFTSVGFVLGLLIGSFLNVVAYRVPAHIPLTRESRCPRCDTPIPPWQNVPVVSWLALGGRCAACGASISPRYPLVEAITGVAFAVVTWWAITLGVTGNGAEQRHVGADLPSPSPTSTSRRSASC